MSGRYYFSDTPFLALWGDRYLPISRPYSQFLVDAATGRLPTVSFVDRGSSTRAAGSGDDHPHADLRVGDAFLSQTFHAVASGPKWTNTVFIVTYDEWGGFFDHVAPPRSVAANTVDPADTNGEVLLGMRVPVVVASPWSRAGAAPRVNSELFDHTSILKLIEWRWNLPNLTARDAPSSNITNLVHALDLAHPNPIVPSLPTLLTPHRQRLPAAARHRRGRPVGGATALAADARVVSRGAQRPTRDASPDVTRNTARSPRVSGILEACERCCACCCFPGPRPRTSR